MSECCSGKYQLVMKHILVIIVFAFFTNARAAPQFLQPGNRRLQEQDILNQLRTNIHLNGNPELNIGKRVQHGFENFAAKAVQNTVGLVNKTVQNLNKIILGGQVTNRHTTQKPKFPIPLSITTSRNYFSKSTILLVTPTPTTFKYDRSTPRSTISTLNITPQTKIITEDNISNYLNDKFPVDIRK